MPGSKREVIVSEKAPPALGPYSAAIRTENHVFLAGQVGLDPSTGKLVEGGIEAETRQALTNLANLLEAAGSSMKSVVKTSVFLAALEEYPQMNAVYGTFFPEAPPARSTVQVAGLPADARVEIEAIALLNPTVEG